jgi:hypothetical protein
LKGPHSGENIAALLSTVIDFYNISADLGFFMMDNASNNDTCVTSAELNGERCLTMTSKLI